VYVNISLKYARVGGFSMDHQKRQVLHRKVYAQYAQLVEVHNEYIEALMDEIASYAVDRNFDMITRRSTTVKSVQEYKARVKSLQAGWGEVPWGCEVVEPCTPYMGPDTHSFSDRTEYKVVGGNVKVETYKNSGGIAYTNLIPLDIFIDIATNTLNYIDMNGYTKTTDVLRILEKKIIEETDYKRTPRAPVYATFRVLVKDGILQVDEKNSHKYLLKSSKEDFQKWMSQFVELYKHNAETIK
jgi:uncharacterized protein YutE (UPF0331/DUF86 family)